MKRWKVSGEGNDSKSGKGKNKVGFIFFYFPNARRSDNEKIWKYQRLYKGGDKRAIKDLFNSMRECAKRFIFYEREKKGFYISREDVNEKAIEAAEYIIEQYIKRPDFELQIPSAYIRLRVLAALYRHKKIEEYISYTDREF